MKTRLRHLIAVVAGFLALVIGQIVIDGVLLHVYPLPPGMRLGTTPMLEIAASRPLAALALYNVLRLPLVAVGAWTTAHDWRRRVTVVTRS